jgi:hypothetical protein
MKTTSSIIKADAGNLISHLKPGSTLFKMKKLEAKLKVRS